MIVGAGIVGSYLGALVGDCEIWDDKKEVSEKACSGLLSLSGLKGTKLPYKECIINEIKGAEIHSDTQTLTIKKNMTQAYVLDRFLLQKQVIQMAEDNNCKFLWGRKWEGEEDRFVIGADGGLSKVAESMDVKHNFIHAYQITADLKTDSELVQLFFSHKYAPGFFAWLIPENENTCRIGIGVRNGNPRKALQNFMRDKVIEAKQLRKEQSALIPIYDGKKTVEKNKVLIGDAAAQVKATTGGGIIFSCKIAEVLKESINRGQLDYYEKEWRKAYEKDLKTHQKIRQFLDKTDYDSFFEKLNKNNVPKTIEEHGDMEHPLPMMKKLLVKPGLWNYLPKFL